MNDYDEAARRLTDAELKHKQNHEAYLRRKERNRLATLTLFDGEVKGDLPGRASRPSTGGRPKSDDR